MAVKVKLNSATIQQYLDGQHGVREDLLSRANRVLAHAKADQHDETYAYENSLHLTQDQTDRLVIRVVASAPHAHLVEAQFGVLARALDAAGS